MKATNSFHGLELYLMRCFQVLYVERSVTAAAIHLSLSQGAVSASLAKLRIAFADPLFVRLSHGLMPTAKAHEVFTSISSILDDVEQLLRPETSFDPATISATLRVCATDQVQMSVLAASIARLTSIAPNLRLKIVSPHPQRAQDWLRDGDVDLAVGSPRTPLRGFRTRLLYNESFVCIASNNHPVLAGNKVISLDQMCEIPHYAVNTSPGSYYSSVVDEALERLKRRRKVALEGPSFLLAPHVVASSDLVAIVPERTGTWGREHFGLSTYTLPIAIPPFGVRLYWHERTHTDPLNRWLREQLSHIA
jgi:DNA-binding transcriptional LysR family regulator